MAASAFLVRFCADFFSVEPGTQGNDLFIQVAYDIASHLIGIDHQDRSTMRAQCSFQVLGGKRHELAAVLAEDDAFLPITDLPKEPSA